MEFCCRSWARMLRKRIPCSSSSEPNSTLRTYKRKSFRILPWYVQYYLFFRSKIKNKFFPPFAEIILPSSEKCHPLGRDLLPAWDVSVVGLLRCSSKTRRLRQVQAPPWFPLQWPTFAPEVLFGNLLWFYFLIPIFSFQSHGPTQNVPGRVGPECCHLVEWTQGHAQVKLKTN